MELGGVDGGHVGGLGVTTGCGVGVGVGQTVGHEGWDGVGQVGGMRAVVLEPFTAYNKITK